MSEYQLCLAFERGDYINLEDLPRITNYICGHLIIGLLIEVTLKFSIII